MDPPAPAPPSPRLQVRSEKTYLLQDEYTLQPLKILDPASVDTEGGAPSNTAGSSKEQNHAGYTVDEALDAIGLGTPYVAIGSCVAVGMIAVYAQVILMASIGSSLYCYLSASSNQAAFISTVFFIGEIVSTYPVGRLNDMLGRRLSLILLSANLLYFGFLFAVVPTMYPWVLFLRLLIGVYACGIQSTVYCYTGELAPSKYRTLFMMLLLFASGIGSVYTPLTAYFGASAAGWRYQAGFASLPAGVVLITAVFIPESPRYYALTGNVEKATEILQKMALRTGKTLTEGDLVLQTEHQKHGSFLNLLRRDTVRQTACLWILGFSTYFTYYGAALSTLFFTENFHIVTASMQSELLASSNASLDSSVSSSSDVVPLDDAICLPQLTAVTCAMDSFSTSDMAMSLVVGLGDLLAAPVSLCLILVIGRRAAMWGSLTLAAVCLVTLMFTYATYNPVALILSIRCLTLGAFGTLFLYAVEAYPTFTRASAVATCQFFAKGAGALTPFIASSFLPDHPPEGIAVYAGFCIMGALAGLLLPFETAGRQLM